MPAIKRILVAVKKLDGKPLPAVLKGAQLARAYGAQLELFHGLTTSLYTEPVAAGDRGLVSLEQDLRQNALRRLEAIADRLRVHSIKVTVSAEWDYPAHEAIIRRAQVIKTDLIVASLHPGRHRMPWLLRLTDWELVRLSPVPVLLVKSPQPYRHPAVLAAIDPTHAHEKPLQLDKQILRVGKALGTALRGSLHAVHARTRASRWVSSPRGSHQGPWKTFRRTRNARRKRASAAPCGRRESHARDNISSPDSPSTLLPRLRARVAAQSS
jgi:universal stress protein E